MWWEPHWEFIICGQLNGPNKSKATEKLIELDKYDVGLDSI